jgi:hypothetical protein
MMDSWFPLIVAFIIGAVSALVPFKINERKIAAEYIIKERQTWREKIRKLSLEVLGVKEIDSYDIILSLYGELSMILNPIDPEDNEILNILWGIKDDPSNKLTRIEFIERITLLLKHDWERAKKEAGSRWNRKEVKRVKYSTFKYKRKNTP